MTALRCIASVAHTEIYWFLYLHGEKCDRDRDLVLVNVPEALVANSVNMTERQLLYRCANTMREHFTCTYVRYILDNKDITLSGDEQSLFDKLTHNSEDIIFQAPFW
jgi:alpha-galactosidase